jgi:hypothetical protein
MGTLSHAQRNVEAPRQAPESEALLGHHDHDLQHVERTLVMLKFLYFLSGITASTWGRFSSVYYNQHGLSV